MHLLSEDKWVLNTFWVLHTFYKSSLFFKPLWKLLVDMVSKFFNILIVSVNEMDFMDYLPFDNQ